MNYTVEKEGLEKAMQEQQKADRLANKLILSILTLTLVMLGAVLYNLFTI